MPMCDQIRYRNTALTTNDELCSKEKSDTNCTNYERGSAYQRYSKFIQITPKEPPPSMPKRNRYRTIFKKARFGGTCVEESFWSNIDENEGLVWQNEDCKLCPEHCLTPNNTDILNYPLLKYPGDDAQCVGYCPSMIKICCNKTKYFVLLQYD